MANDSNELKQVLDGEKVRRFHTIHDDIVRIHHVSLNKPTKSHYELDWFFDFTGVSKEELQVLAAKKTLIDARRKFKDDKNPGPEWNDYTVNVREMIDSGRGTPKSPVKSATNLWNEMTESEQAEFLAAIQQKDEDDS